MSRDARLYPLRQTHVEPDDDALWNWAQNAQIGSRHQVQRPASEAELQRLIRESHGQIRVIGSKLSPGRMLHVSDDDVLLDLSALSGQLASDEQSVTFGGATPLEQVYRSLTEMNRMLASSPGVIAIQTLAGAMATGTHGQGLQQSSIADEALAIRMVLADGSVREFVRGDADFPAAQVSLGALGIVTAVTLRTQPFSIFTCHKYAVSADTLEEDLLRWNNDYPLSKAWWFVDDNLMHVWNAHEASDEERQRYEAQGRQVVEHEGDVDESLNDTIDQTLAHMHRDTQIEGKGENSFAPSPVFVISPMLPVTFTSSSAAALRCRRSMWKSACRWQKPRPSFAASSSGMPRTVRICTTRLSCAAPVHHRPGSVRPLTSQPAFSASWSITPTMVRCHRKDCTS